MAAVPFIVLTDHLRSLCCSFDFIWMLQDELLSPEPIDDITVAIFKLFIHPIAKLFSFPNVDLLIKMNHSFGGNCIKR